MNNSPSKFFTKLFEQFCNDSFYEELQGDLEERFYINSEEKGIKKAQSIYRSEIIKMLRPSVIRKVKYQKLNNIAMFKNYTLVAFRNLSRNKLFSAINIIGLAVSMAVCLIAITFVTEIKNYDGFHENRNQIYRVFNTRTNRGSEPQVYATTSLLTGTKLKEQSSAFATVVPIYNGFNGNLKKGENSFSIRGLFVGEEFLDLFTFPLRYGNAETALDEPFSVVLTEETALRIFSRSDVVGEILERGRAQFTVTGVMANPPSTSHLKFNAVASLKTYETRPQRPKILSDWGTMWQSYVYVQLKDNVNLEQAQESLNLIAKEENTKSEAFKIQPGLEPLMSIFPGDGKFNQLGTVMPKKNLDQIVILALIVLFSACFNYANLSIARSLKRAKEVGIRKVVGAKKGQLYVQFVSEAVIVSLLSLILGFFLFKLIRPEFLSLNIYTSRTTTLNLTTEIYCYFIGFALLIGILAGTLPAILMTKIKTIKILKGISGIKPGQGLTLRKAMIGLQFIFSMGFAIMVILAEKQYKHALNFDLGYQTENVVNVYTDGRDPMLLKTAFGKLPSIEGISTSYFLHSTGTLNSDWAKNIAGTDSAYLYNNFIDTDYLENMNHQILAGQNFNMDGPGNQIIVNEKLLERFQLGKPDEALGKQIDFLKSRKVIVGVVKDFHYGTIYNELKPYAFVLDKDREMYYMNLNVNTTDMAGTLAELGKVWEEIYPGTKISASFYANDIERTYNDLSSALKTFTLLAIIAISISILGLLGMAVYMAESRIKELTIRKVLGASLSNLVLHLSKSFVVIFIVAAAIAIPVTNYLFKELVLTDLEYTNSVGFWELASGALITMVIAFLTISSQMLRAAKSNPAKSLRNE